MGYTDLKSILDANIKTNGSQSITGAKLNQVMTQLLQGVDIENRENGVDTTGMNYKILDKSMTFVDQVTETDTIYEIRDTFDLANAIVTIPSGCILLFNGGKLSNGTIATPYTQENLSVIHYGGTLVYKKNKVYQYKVIVRGLSDNTFNNVSFDGLFDVQNVTYKSFTGYSSDTDLLSAIFNLSMPGEIPCVVDLEPGKTYNVTSTKSDYSDSIFEFTCISHKTINGNAAIINDQRTRTFFDTAGSYVAVFGFWKSNDLTIRGLSYQNNTTDWPVGEVYDLNVTGAAFIHTFLDCDNINVSIKTYGARYGFIHGEYSNYWWCGDNGLTNSKVNVSSSLTGYPLVVQIGENLDLWVHSETDHRSAYIMGVYNARIYVESKNHYCAPIPCLIADFRYSGEYGTTKYRGYGDLDVVFKDLGTTNLDCQNSDGTTFEQSDPQCVGFVQWAKGLVTGRDFAIHVSNINVNVYIPSGSKMSGINFQPNDSDRNNADVFDNIKIKVFSDADSVGKINRILYTSDYKYSNIEFTFVSRNKNGDEVYVTNRNTSAVRLVGCITTGTVVIAGSVNFYDSSFKNVLPFSGETATIIARNSTATSWDNGILSLSGRLTGFNKFPLSSDMSGKGRGYLCFRNATGLLIYSGGWYAIPLYPVTIDATRQTSALQNVGATSARPSSPSSTQKGFPYYDTSLKKPIWQEGYNWVEADGETAGIKRFGATTDRPTPTNKGFCFFDETLGKPIWYTGSGWVDATGGSV